MNDPGKNKMEKLNFIKMKNFCSVKNTINRMKRQANYWEKIFAAQIADKGFVLKNVQRTVKTQSFKNSLGRFLNGQRMSIVGPPKAYGQPTDTPHHSTFCKHK